MSDSISQEEKLNQEIQKIRESLQQEQLKNNNNNNDKSSHTNNNNNNNNNSPDTDKTNNKFSKLAVGAAAIGAAGANTQDYLETLENSVKANIGQAIAPAISISKNIGSMTFADIVSMLISWIALVLRGRIYEKK